MYLVDVAKLTGKLLITTCYRAAAVSVYRLLKQQKIYIYNRKNNFSLGFGIGGLRFIFKIRFPVKI